MPLELSVEQARTPSGELLVRVGHDLLDDYLTFLASRARPNSVLAAAFAPWIPGPAWSGSQTNR